MARLVPPSQTTSSTYGESTLCCGKTCWRVMRTRPWTVHELTDCSRHHHADAPRSPQDVRPRRQVRRLDVQGPQDWRDLPRRPPCRGGVGGQTEGQQGGSWREGRG